MRSAVSSGARLRVLQIGKYYPPHKGGIETHLQLLCTSLRNIVDLSVIVASDNRIETDDTVDGVPVRRVGTPLTLFSAPLCPAMASRIRTSPADIIHIHLPNPPAVLAYLASGHRGRLVITYHSDIVRQRVLGALQAPILHAALRRGAAIIASSPNYVKTSPVLRAYRDRCRVIPFGIPVEEFAQVDRAAVDRIRREHGSPLVLSIGRLVYYKGFEYLIRAMTHVDAKLLIIGVGPLRSKLERLAIDCGVADKVTLTGEINGDLAPYYHAADVFALPSITRAEAFGIVQIEAMAASIPVVNTQLASGVPFVSLHEQTGLTVPPTDPGALAAALNRLLNDPQLRRSLGSAAHLRACNEFDLNLMASRTFALYQEVMALPAGVARPG